MPPEMTAKDGTDHNSLNLPSANAELGQRPNLSSSQISESSGQTPALPGRNEDNDKLDSFPSFHQDGPYFPSPMDADIPTGVDLERHLQSAMQSGISRERSDYMTASEGLDSSSTNPYGEFGSGEASGESSQNHSGISTPADRFIAKHKERGRVRFNSTSEVNDDTNTRFSFPLRDYPVPTSEMLPPKPAKPSKTHSRHSSVSSAVMRHTPDVEKSNPFDDPTEIPMLSEKSHTNSPILKSQSDKKAKRPTVLRLNSDTRYNTDLDGVTDDGSHTPQKFSALQAQERAQRIALQIVGSHSAPTSRRGSFEEDTEDESRAPLRKGAMPAIRLDDIPLVDMSNHRFDGYSTEDEDSPAIKERQKASATTEAHQLVRAHTRKLPSHGLRIPITETPGLVSGQVTPTEELFSEDYVTRPKQYRGGVLSSLLKLYNAPNPSTHHRGNSSGDISISPSVPVTPGSSGTTTPRGKAAKWYNHKNQSRDTLAGLIEASAILGATASGSIGDATNSRPKSARPLLGNRSPSARLMEATMNRVSRPRLEDEIRITVHIAETLSRQKYLIKLCRALMAYGAPTHRLEEYMKMTSRVLEIEGQFLYIPGCMIVSFDDMSTHTTEVKLVRTDAGIDLGRLKDVHEIYKEVVHDVIGVEEATQRLDILTHKKPKHNKWFLVIVYGLASASVGPFAFQARLIDLPPAFLLGSLLGVLQLVVAPRSNLYSNVFEITAAVMTSFLARAFGSIQHDGSPLFCFSALAQSSIALILPGYLVLCGSLELQSRSMVAGSVRMVYAIIYSLFLGFGITIGTAVYGLMDSNATSATTCSNPINQYYRFFFVPVFTMCLAVINQAKWKQTPVMLIIAFAGYIVNFFSAMKFPSNAQVSNTLGALAVGIMGNLYSRLRHGVAAAALLPAIFVQVPSGLAASGSLLAGLSSAEAITNTTYYSNGTAKVSGTSSVTVTSTTDLNSIVFNVGFSMIQVAIGITVGLFLSAIIVYPFGKRRSGLFSF